MNGGEGLYEIAGIQIKRSNNLPFLLQGTGTNGLWNPWMVRTTGMVVTSPTTWSDLSKDPRRSDPLVLASKPLVWCPRHVSGWPDRGSSGWVWYFEPCVSNWSRRLIRRYYYVSI